MNKGILTLLVAASLSLQADYLRDSSKQIVLDTFSGLVWQDNAIGIKMNWTDAITTCENLELGGYSDWRLPNYNELYQLSDRSRYNPAISPVFVNVTSSVYWSATINASVTSAAWTVNFSGGDDDWYNRADSNYVRCVRGGQ